MTAEGRPRENSPPHVRKRALSLTQRSSSAGGTRINWPQTTTRMNGCTRRSKVSTLTPRLRPPPCGSARSGTRLDRAGRSCHGGIAAETPGRAIRLFDALRREQALERARAAREALSPRPADQRRPARSPEPRPPRRAARAGRSPASFRRRRGTPPTSRRRRRRERLEPRAKTALAARADAPSAARSTPSSLGPALASHGCSVPVYAT